VDRRRDIKRRLEAASRAWENLGGRWQRLRQSLAAGTGEARRSLEAIYSVLYNYTAITSQAVREEGAVTRGKIHRPIRPSETIDDDVSTASVFLVAILMMIVVTAALFFALSSTFPNFSSP